MKLIFFTLNHGVHAMYHQSLVNQVNSFGAQCRASTHSPAAGVYVGASWDRNEGYFLNLERAKAVESKGSPVNTWDGTRDSKFRHIPGYKTPNHSITQDAAYDHRARMEMAGCNFKVIIIHFLSKSFVSSFQMIEFYFIHQKIGVK